jgi:hypothetical protein
MSNTTLMMPIAMGEHAIGEFVLVPVTLPQAWKDVLLERRSESSRGRPKTPALRQGGNIRLIQCPKCAGYPF